MCGIVGYVGHREAVPVLVKGLENLEYRGYDSAGIACLNHQQGSLFVIKEKGKLSALKEQLEGIKISSNVGIGHTRWATHGEPSRTNAHPHVDDKNRIAIIHNGIVENYASLKSELRSAGFRFRSQTDTEVAVNLISSYYKKDNVIDALRKAVKRMHGFFAFVVLSKENPDKLYVFKRSNPIAIGLGEGENFVASDVTAFLSYTHRVIYLEDDEYAVISPKSVEVFSLETAKAVRREPIMIRWNISQAQKGGFAHFMLKEIFEQPRVLEETILKRLDPKGNIIFESFTRGTKRRLGKIKRIFLVSCGTAHHAALVGNYMLGKHVRIPTQTSVSSEFRYEDPVIGKDDLVILITQSGETADTLAALRLAREKKAMTLAIVNVVGSTIAREADAVIYTQAGPEIGVASTKAYTAQLATLIFLTLYLAHLRKTMSPKDLAALLRQFKKIPEAASQALKQAKAVEKCARKHYHRRNFLYLGRGYNFPTALEGALKLKEISYAHAHGYPAGEMKHGPIALIDHEQPVICIAPLSKTYEKMISNIEEIRARSGIVIAIGTKGDKTLARLAANWFEIPKLEEIFTPILAAIPLQLFAYYVASLNNRDVDQPRNLAKSVTVE